MALTILLTGRPGVGKTTVVREIARKLGETAGGFYTTEIREGGRRKGFKIVTLDGQEGILADIDIQGRPRVSKYGVKLRDLEEIGVASLRRAVRQGRYVVVDEIGRMELLSELFRTAVVEAIESDSPVIGTIMQGHDPWVDWIKKLSHVIVLELTPANRDTMAQRVVDMLDHGSASASS
jgi:nucleoside-triphosphatase